MGGVLFALLSWMVGTLAGMAAALTVSTEFGLIVGLAAAGLVATAGLVEFIVGLVGAGVRLGLRR